MMKTIRTLVRRGKRPVLLALVLLQFVPVIFARLEDDWEVVITSGIYLQDIKGDTAKALEVFESVVLSDRSERELKAQAVSRMIDCYLQMHQEDLALASFQLLQTRFPEQKAWIQSATSKVPDSFLLQQIPWNEGERISYQWMNPEGVKVGHVVLSVSKIEKEDGTFWRLESRMIGNDYRQYLIDFEPDSLLPSYSYYQLRRFDPLEKEQIRMLGITPGDASLSHNSCDHEAVGHLLRQFPFQLGYRIESDLFKASEGGGITAQIDVTSIETLELIDGRKIGCYAVDVNLEEEACRFWFENSEQKDLVKFQAEGISGERIKNERIAANEPYVFQIHPSGYSLTCPPDWFPIMKAGSEDNPGIRIFFLMPSLDVSFWITEEIDQSELPTDEEMAALLETFCESNQYENPSIRKLGASCGTPVSHGMVVTAEKMTGHPRRAIFSSRIVIAGRLFIATGQCNANQIETWGNRFERVITSLRKD